MVALALLLCIAAWASLSLGMPRHHQALLGAMPTPTRRRLLRGGGWLLLAAAFALCMAAYGTGQGPIFWAAAMVLAAIAWVLLLTFASRRRR
jgi:hypothetical protein